MDNAPTHKSKIIKPLMENINAIYTPQYSPMFNPIEEVFSKLKRDIYNSICENNS